MDVKPEYKQTDVGVIPEDWSLTTFRDIATKIGSGITPTGGSKRYKVSGRPFVRSQNVGWGKLLLDDLVYIDEETHNEFPATELRERDVLLNITGASIGRTAMVNDILVGGNVNQHVCIVRIDTQQAVPEFTHLILLSSLGQHQIASFQAGGNRQGLNFSQIGSIGLPLPPTEAEQEAIAKALSDAEAYIDSLEQLIAKKRLIKQGAMQELLTGKRRLPGFGGEWETKKIGELLQFERPDKYTVRSTEYRHYATTPVLTANKSFILGYTDEDFGVYRNLPAVIFDDFTTDSKYVDFSFKVKSGAIKILTTRSSEMSLKFVSERMRLINFPVGEHKRYYISEYQQIEISVPKPEEQTAITEALSDMDAEIATLEGKLKKARQLKQGMMQELLTGRTRLI